MGAEHHKRAIGHVGQLLDEDGALVAQFIEHIAIVHDLMTHIDRRAIFLQRPLHNVDRANNPGAKRAGLRENDSERSAHHTLTLIAGTAFCAASSGAGPSPTHGQDVTPRSTGSSCSGPATGHNCVS